MPQFDKIILFSQVYWLTILFFILYSLITQMYLPRLSLVFKIRRIVLQELFGSSSNLFLVCLKSNLRSLFVSTMLLSSILSSMQNIFALDNDTKGSVVSDIESLVKCYLDIYLNVPTSGSTVLASK
jgi:hypothetical protein|uniref:ATP synthase F0 subunit 8 n=1 Tax=Leucocryptos marina TaxID=299206 RepID=A0A679EJW9_LEUMA|nr:ATP synthase F0 subunit 8 [Leucocryptos marina]BBQ05423.1 ATP synthase F0 subunit 8 [Leucocryptos marina]